MSPACVCLCVCVPSMSARKAFAFDSQWQCDICNILNISAEENPSTGARHARQLEQSTFPSVRDCGADVAFVFVPDGSRIAPLLGQFSPWWWTQNKHMPSILTDYWQSSLPQKNRNDFSRFSVVCVSATPTTFIFIRCYDFGRVGVCELTADPNCVRTFGTIIFDCFLFVTFEQTTPRRIQTILTWPLQYCVCVRLLDFCACRNGLLVTIASIFVLFFFYFLFIFFCRRSLCQTILCWTSARESG